MKTPSGSISPEFWNYHLQHIPETQALVRYMQVFQNLLTLSGSKDKLKITYGLKYYKNYSLHSDRYCVVAKNKIQIVPELIAVLHKHQSLLSVDISAKGLLIVTPDAIKTSQRRELVLESLRKILKKEGIPILADTGDLLFKNEDGLKQAVQKFKATHVIGSLVDENMNILHYYYGYGDSILGVNLTNNFINVS